MTSVVAPPQPITIEMEWHIPYNYSVGTGGTRFLEALCDEAAILATRCSACDLTQVPGRTFCPRCLASLEEWIAVGPGGVIESITVCHEAYEGLPKPPFAVAIVRLDGADTGIANLVTGIDYDAPPMVGDRVTAVFSDRREASINDFHFEFSK